MALKFLFFPQALINAWFRHYYDGVKVRYLEDALALIEQYMLVREWQFYYHMHHVVHEMLVQDCHKTQSEALQSQNISFPLLKWHYSVAAAFADIFLA